jgi:RNA polymerase sigma-70 factor (ECF subfamily)
MGYTGSLDEQHCNHPPSFVVLLSEEQRVQWSTMGPIDDADIAALLATDLDANYERLVSKYWHQLYTFVSRRMGSSQDAEDIVQEAFVRAYLALARFPTQRVLSLKIRPWLYKITWNVYCTATGKSKSPPMVPLDTSEDSPLLEQEEQQSEQPEFVFERLEHRGELEALVGTLPAHFREIVSLYYFEELSHQEIADILNQPIGTIKVYVHRGIRLLRKRLETQANEVK